MNISPSKLNSSRNRVGRNYAWLVALLVVSAAAIPFLLNRFDFSAVSTQIGIGILGVAFIVLGMWTASGVEAAKRERVGYSQEEIEQLRAKYRKQPDHHEQAANSDEIHNSI